MATWRQARRSRVALSPSRRPLSATTGRARRETEKMDAAALPLVTSGRSARAVGDSGASCDSDGGSGGGLQACDFHRDEPGVGALSFRLVDRGHRVQREVCGAGGDG